MALWFLVGPLLLQAQQPMEIPLRVRSTVPVPGQTQLRMLLPLRCDTEGGLYFRSTTSFGNALASPVMRISPDGKKVVTFPLEAAPGFARGSAFDDFTVSPRGKVYLLAFQRSLKEEESDEEEIPKLVLVAFDREGKYDSVITLNRLFHPGKLAVFPSGEFLISGIKIDENIKLTGEPFTGIFDAQGRLIKEFAFEDDIRMTKVEETQPLPQESETLSVQPSGSPQELSKKDFMAAVSLGAAVSADDGNIYLLRAGRQPFVYVISPDGSLVRRIVVPVPSEHARPVSALHVAGGKVVSVFADRDAAGNFRRHIIVILNAETGEPLLHYLTTEAIGGPLACYTTDGFVFLAGKTGQLQIQHASE